MIKKRDISLALEYRMNYRGASVEVRSSDRRLLLISKKKRIGSQYAYGVLDRNG